MLSLTSKFHKFKSDNSFIKYLLTNMNSPASVLLVYILLVNGSKHSLFPNICDVLAVGIGATNSEFLSPYLIILFFTILITCSFLGYGLITANYINKDILEVNIGYIGLIGLLTCTIISYITIYFSKHGFFHNIILHAFGLCAFYYFFPKKKTNFKQSRRVYCK